MNLSEAYDLMDLLLDKADQPYFTTLEKDKFLDLAISDFINMHYQKMTVDEDSRRALSGCIDYISFKLEDSEIIAGEIFDDKYPAGWSIVHGDKLGHWQNENQYVSPRRHLYTLSIAVNYFNKDEIIDPTTSLPYASKTEDDIVRSERISLKNKSTRDFYEDHYSADPFNKSTQENPKWSYIENRMVFTDRLKACNIDIQFILLPTVDEAFRADQIQMVPRFEDHYQKQIIELAVKRMTQVDVGLMTPPS